MGLSLLEILGSHCWSKQAILGEVEQWADLGYGNLVCLYSVPSLANRGLASLILRWPKSL